MDELTRDERKRLLGLARASIEEALLGTGGLGPLLERIEMSAALCTARGAFVTLRRGGLPPRSPEALRGCVGTVNSCEPLYRTVVDFAPQAALKDPRFPPLAVAELAGLCIEISVLTAPTKLARIDDLILGRDGIELRRGQDHAVLLPQVAAEQRWTVEQLLRSLALKAGLDQDGWCAADLSVFQAEVFGEER